MAVGLAPVVQPRHGLLTDVAALREAHRALVEARLLGDRALVDVHPVAGPAALDAHDLRRRLADGGRAGIDEGLPHPLQVGGLAQRVDSVGGRDQSYGRTAVRRRFPRGEWERGWAVGPARRARCGMYFFRPLPDARRTPARRGRSARAARTPACACAAPPRSRSCSGGSCRTALAAPHARCRAAARWVARLNRVPPSQPPRPRGSAGRRASCPCW